MTDDKIPIPYFSIKEGKINLNVFFSQKQIVRLIKNKQTSHLLTIPFIREIKFDETTWTYLNITLKDRKKYRKRLIASLR